MRLLEIAMLRHLGIETYDDTCLQLTFAPYIANHLETMHAGALYTLAEAQSALFLQQRFPSLEGKVLPLLREGSMKYFKTATQTVIAYATTDADALQNFKERLFTRGRGILSVEVRIEQNGEVCAQGMFKWTVFKN